MLRLRLNEIMVVKRINTRQLSAMTGIRWNTVDDMAKNVARHWLPENLERIMIALEIEHIEELIEFVRVADSEQK